MAIGSSQHPGARLVRCTEHSLAYDPAVATGCALCRRSARPDDGRRSVTRSLLLGLAALVAASAGYFVFRSNRAPISSVAAALGLGGGGAAGRTGRLATTNEAGRAGTYYLPTPSNARPVPVLVAIHSTGSSGSDMVAAFQKLADEHSFAIVAPDSRRSPDGQLTWQVGDTPGDVTPDLTHVLACLAELRRLAAAQALVLSPDVLIVGYSGGASSAPYVGTNSNEFAAFAVLHGGVFPGGLGRHSIRGWFSTGQSDPLRPPAQVQAAAEAARGKGLATVYREFPGGHELSAAEAAALIAWWRSGAD